MATLTNERKQFGVESNSENLKLTGTVTYTEVGEVKNFSGNINLKGPVEGIPSFSALGSATTKPTALSRVTARTVYR